MVRGVVGQLVVAGVFAMATMAVQAAVPVEGTWRLVRAQPAPWADASEVAMPAGWIGQSLSFEPGRSLGPGVLTCGQASFTQLDSPFEGLFQGGLPAPADQAAKALGFSAAPVETLRMDCDSGSFDFHAADPQTLLFALDNVIWTLAHSAGTEAGAGTPEATAQTLLERHFAGDMGFAAESWSDKRALIDSTLNAAIDHYFAQPMSPDEVPPIDGDPLTDSQEYPARFLVDSAQPDGDCVRVPVRYADAWQTTAVSLRLCKAGASWKLNDVFYTRGGSFTDLLKMAPE